ncbi:acetate kinase [Marinomonas agarivorans]|nr:acetate kinase [Marinomonas agarivorans]
MKEAVLIINSGSSSLKFAVLSHAGEKLVMQGVADRLNSNQAEITINYAQTSKKAALVDGSHQAALIQIKQWLEQKPDILNSLTGVGHRIVHGGERFTDSALIDEQAIQQIKACIPLAPLHNPAGLKGIEACFSLFGHLPQVAVFDTSFHQTLSNVEYLYPIPIRYYRDHGLRKYGFHGTSFRYISRKLTQLEPESTNSGVVVAHLGNGASTCAIFNGQSVDTSMGLTPLEGMMMGTRSGSVDPTLVAAIAQRDQLNTDDALTVLSKESGLLGISELSNDCRTLEEAMNAGDERAKLALDMFCTRAAKNIVSVATSLTTLSHLVFTGGIGENSNYVRQNIVQNLSILGIQLDTKENIKCPRGQTHLISPAQQRTKVWVIPTNEELMIALDTIKLIRQPENVV